MARTEEFRQKINITTNGASKTVKDMNAISESVFDIAQSVDVTTDSLQALNASLDKTVKKVKEMGGSIKNIGTENIALATGKNANFIKAHSGSTKFEAMSSDGSLDIKSVEKTMKNFLKIQEEQQKILNELKKEELEIRKGFLELKAVSTPAYAALVAERQRHESEIYAHKNARTANMIARTNLLQNPAYIERLQASADKEVLLNQIRNTKEWKLAEMAKLEATARLSIPLKEETLRSKVLKNERMSDPLFKSAQASKDYYAANFYTTDKLLLAEQRKIQTEIAKQKLEGTYNPKRKATEESAFIFGKSFGQGIKKALYEMNRSARRRQGFGGAIAKTFENRFPMTIKGSLGSTENGKNIGIGALAGLGFVKALQLASKGLKHLSKAAFDAFKGIETTKMSMEVVYGSRTQMEAEFSKIAEYATRSPFGVHDTADFAVLLRQSGAYASDVLNTIKMLGDTAGGSAEKMKRIANNYAQVLSVGKASMLDMRQFAYAGIPIFKEMSKELGVNQAELRKMISEGAATASVVEKVFKNMTSEGGIFHGAVQKGATTLAARTQNMQDIRQLALASLGQWGTGSLLTKPTEGGELNSLFGRLLGFVEKIWGVVEKIGKRATEKASLSGMGRAESLLAEYKKEEKELELLFDLTEDKEYKKELKELREKIKTLETNLYDGYSQDTLIKSFEKKQKKIDKAIEEEEEASGELAKLMGYSKAIKAGKEKGQILDVAKTLDMVDIEKVLNKYTVTDELKDAAYELSTVMTLVKGNEDEIIRLKSSLGVMGVDYSDRANDKNYTGAAKTGLDALRKAEDRLESLQSSDSFISQALMNFAIQIDDSVDEFKKGNESFAETAKALEKKQTTREKFAVRERNLQSYARKMNDAIHKEYDADINNSSNTISIIRELYKNTPEAKKEEEQKNKLAIERGNKLKNSIDALRHKYETDDTKGILKEFAENNDMPSLYEGIKKILTPEGVLDNFNAHELNQETIDVYLRNAEFLNKITQEILSTNENLSDEEREDYSSAKNLLSSFEKEMNSLPRGINGGFNLDDEVDETDFTTLGDDGKILSVQKRVRHSISEYVQNLIEGLKEIGLSFNELFLNEFSEPESFSKQLGSVEAANAMKNPLSLWRRILGSSLGIDPYFTRELTVGSIVDAYSGGIKQRRNTKDVFAQALKTSGIEEAFSKLIHKEDIYRLKGPKGKDSTLQIDWVKTGKSLKDFAMSLASAASVTNAFVQSRQAELQQLESFMTSAVFTEEEIQNLQGEQAELFKSFLGYSGDISDLNINAFAGKMIKNEDGTYSFTENSLKEIQALIKELKKEIESGTLVASVKSFEETVRKQNSLEMTRTALYLDNSSFGILAKTERDDILGVIESVAQQLEKTPQEVLDYWIKARNGEPLSEDFKTLPAVINTALLSMQDRRAATLGSEVASLLVQEPKTNSLGLKSLGLEGSISDVRRGLFAGKEGYQNLIGVKEWIRSQGGISGNVVEKLFSEGMIDENKQDRTTEMLLRYVSVIQKAKDAMQDLGDATLNAFNSSVLNGFSSTFKSLGESLRDGAFNVEDIGNAWKNAAQSMLDSIGPAAISAGLTQIAAGHLGLGIGLVAAGGGAQFLSGLFSKEDENDENLSRLETLRDLLADMLKQARVDAEYYDRNSRHRNAVASNESLNIMSVDDAVISPTGRIITTDPNDFLIATKTPETLGTTRSSPVVNFTIVNEGGQQLNVSKTETIETPNGIDIKAFVVAVTQEAAAKGQLDGAFSMMQARQQGRRVSY